MSTPYEGGLRPGRLEYIRESTTGTTPSDPTWELFSDNARSVEPSFDPGIEGQEGLGTPDMVNHRAGTEASSLSVTYDLQQKSASGNTLLDGSSNPNDAVTDAFERSSDNTVQNTHTVVRRFNQSSIDAEQTIEAKETAGDGTSRDTRQYIVGKGGHPDATLTNDADSPQPVMATVEYEFEKLRMYQFDQPTSSTELAYNVSTDSSNDQNVNVTFEDEGASTSETVATNATDATNLESTSNTYGDLDALELASELEGDLLVFINSGTAGSPSAGDQIAVIRGQNSYDHGEGDLGVPALGGGSHASNFGQSYEITHDDSVERPSGTGIADVINTVEFSVDNNYDGVGQLGTSRRALAAGGRDAQAAGTIAGQTDRVKHVDDMLRTQDTNLVWSMEGGSLQLDSATVTEASGTSEARQGRMAIDVTIEGKGVTVS